MFCRHGDIPLEVGIPLEEGIPFLGVIPYARVVIHFPEWYTFLLFFLLSVPPTSLVGSTAKKEIFQFLRLPLMVHGFTTIENQRKISLRK